MLLIPAKNPKHNQKRVSIQRQQEIASTNYNKRRLFLMAVIFVVVIAIAIVVIINIDSILNTPKDDDVIENGDYVKFSYKIWRDENGDGSANDEWNGGDSSTIVFQNTISEFIFYDADATNSTYSEFFVSNVEGMEVGQNKYISLAAVTDENDDGIDDDTGEPIWGFQSYPALKGRELIIYIEILDILKPGDENYPVA